MIRRAFLSSKSNTGAREIVIKKACQKVVQMDHKNEDISEYVNSFDAGTIFPDRLGHKLSRNGFVVSVYALEKNLCWRIGFRHDQIFRKDVHCKQPGKISFGCLIAADILKL